MIEPAAGILLIADPFLKDPNFMRTVVFMCEHNAEGSFGFVLNKQFDYTLDELITSFEGYPVPVYYGGPVDMDTIHFLHQYPDKIPDSQEVMKGVYWGGNFETLTELVKNNEIDFSKIRFFIGYSGWGKGQLNNELSEKTWLTVSAKRNIVFHENPQEVWKDSLKHLGGDYEMMVNFPIDPQLN
ncbi:YqgE/AlgH family protein [Ferruginibacter lapsinanis]|uniref:YqgE/AlgH family protein n=1 Tax=Ferruginibacter lapsinanis TaxID=563172 RepID=UPI001E4C871B|nr:YqgE/AlgH family protein [Ferruginibacter lapsinanis]UEG50304.1 YqgE/AlgH family protein [Ferruginibacter lapsinanis]